MDHLKEKYNFTISLLEYGPGLPVDYFETGIDEAKLLHDLSTLLDRLDPNLEIVLEIGRRWQRAVVIILPCRRFETDRRI